MTATQVRGGRLRVGQWVVGIVAVFGVVLLAVLLAGLLAVDESVSARQLLTEKVDPAVDAAARLEAATGVERLAVRKGLFEEYVGARTDADRAAASLRALLPDDARLRADLARVGAQGARWRAGTAEPSLAHHAAAPDSAADALVSAITAERAHLHDFQESTLRRVSRAATFLYVWLAASAALLLGAAALSTVALRRMIVTPLALLSNQVDRVAGGEFDAPLRVRGPAEVTVLAHGVDSMRRRIVDEWAFAIEARELLDRQAEDLRRSNAELEQFAYVASHDLQEPLRKVASFCQMLERRYKDQLDERAGQYIGFAVDGARRMQALINDLLAFSRVGRVHADHVVVDTDAIARSTLDTLSLAVEESGGAVTWEPLPAVWGDPVLLGQLFQNLVGNALKFRGDAPPRVHLSARRDGDVWEFCCADNGIGIEPQYADRIFLVFQRLHPRDRYTGTGIGLALCKKIVEYHGGRIWLGEAVAPAEGATAGTTIRWTLPAPAEPAAEPLTNEPEEPDA